MENPKFQDLLNNPQLQKKLDESQKKNKLEDSIIYKLLRKNISQQWKQNSINKPQTLQEVTKGLKNNMIFKVKVYQKSESTIHVQLKEYISYCKKPLQIDVQEEQLKKVGDIFSTINHLQIKAQIDNDEIITDFDILSYHLNFQNVKVGDYLNAIIVGINEQNKIIQMSMKNSHLVGSKLIHPAQSNLQGQCFLLGFSDCKGNSFKSENKQRPLTIYEEKIVTNNQFHNKGNYDILLNEMKLNQHSTILTKNNKFKLIDEDINYKKIRRYQNQIWALESLNQGINLAKDNEFEKSIVLYKHALSFDDQFCDALIAKGCAYANLKQYEKSLGDFQKALQIDKYNKNALKYYELVSQKYEEYKKQPQFHDKNNGFFEKNLGLEYSDKRQTFDSSKLLF